MAKLSVRSGEEVEEGLEYQPLVENTKSAERSDSLPGYRSLSVGQRPANGNNPGIRSSNYLSLIQDEPQDERDYQTLVDNANPQVSQSLTLIVKCNFSKIIAIYFFNPSFENSVVGAFSVLRGFTFRFVAPHSLKR